MHSVLRLIKQNWKWMMAFAAALVPLALPLSFEVKIFCSLTFWAITMWATDAMQYAVVAILLPALYVLTGVGEVSVSFSGWLSTSTWVTLGGLLFGVAFTKSGLARRIAYKMIALFGSSFTGLVVAIVLSCVIVTPVIPSVMGKIVLIMPIVIEVCQALGLEKGNRTAAALVFAAFFALWSPKMAFPTASTDSVLAMSILTEECGYDVTWLGWLTDMLVPACIWTLLSVVLVYLLRPEKVAFGKEERIARYQNLGGFSVREREVGLMMVAVVVLLALQDVHGINPAWVMLGAASLCFFPPLRLLDAGDFRKVDYSVVFFLAGAVSIGAIASEIGVTDSVIAAVKPFLEGQTSLLYVMILYGFSVLCNFLLNPLALIATLLEPATQLCIQLGFSPVLGAYSMIMGFNQALFPYEIAPFMLVYSYGFLNMRQVIKVMSVRIALGFAFMPIVVYPWWCLVGLA